MALLTGQFRVGVAKAAGGGVRGPRPNGAVEQEQDGRLDGTDVVVVPAHFGQFFQKFAEAAERSFAFGAARQAAHDGCANRQF